MKRWLKLLPIAILLVGAGIWQIPHKPGTVKPYAQPETAVRNTQPTPPTEVANSPDTTDATPPTPVTVTPPAPSTALLDIDSTTYPAGMVQSKTFATPEGSGNTWAVNFHYDYPDPGDSITVQVYGVDAGGFANLTNFVIQSPAPPSGEFSFLEPFMGNVFIRVNAGKWHISATPAPDNIGFIYPLVNTQTVADTICVRNKLGQCTPG